MLLNTWKHLSHKNLPTPTIVQLFANFDIIDKCKTQETEKIQTKKSEQQKKKVVRPRPCQSFIILSFEKYCPCSIKQHNMPEIV
jgi:hypothetical protein